MPKKLQSDDDKLMEIFQRHYAELRREHSEYEDTVHKPAMRSRWLARPDRSANFGTDAKSAASSVKDLDSFKAAFGNIGKNDCGGCHEKYRIKNG
jgi:cytochrome c556